MTGPGAGANPGAGQGARARAGGIGGPVSRLVDGGPIAEAALACLASPPNTHAGRSSRTADSLFSSDLTVDEAILLSETGWEPRRLVMGSSVFHIGWVMGGGAWAGGMGTEGELEAVSKAMSDARHMAIGRLVQDGRQAGADAVVGVRLSMKLEGSGRGRAAEFSAVGTAISNPQLKAERHASNADWFVTTDLSGQDFYLLDRAGYEPLGLVFGTCVYYCPPNWSSLSTTNVELDSPTRALTKAREIAMARMQHEGERLRAAGVVGVKVVEHAHAWWRNSIEFLALGTAVGLKGGTAAGAHVPLDVQPVVDLQDDISLTDPSALTGHGGE